MQLSASAEYDYSDWYRRDVSKIEEEVKEKVAKLKPVESHFYSVLCKYKKESPLFYIFGIKVSIRTKKQA